MPFSEYINWGIYFRQKAAEQEQQNTPSGGRNLLDSPDALVKGLTL
jgi:hypothetical protein